MGTGCDFLNDSTLLSQDFIGEHRPGLGNCPPSPGRPLDIPSANPWACERCVSCSGVDRTDLLTQDSLLPTL